MQRLRRSRLSAMANSAELNVLIRDMRKMMDVQRQLVQQIAQTNQLQKQMMAQQMNPPASVKEVPLLPAGELASTTDIVKSHPTVPIVDEDYFLSPTGVADWQMEALNRKQGENET